jgi:hypothetical protein
MPSLTVTRGDWWKIVDAARAKAGDENIPAWVCLVHYYPLCIPSLASPFTRLAWRLWNDLEGFKHEDHSSYMALPAVLVDSFEAINAEIARIDRVRAQKAKVSRGRK